LAGHVKAEIRVRGNNLGLVLGNRAGAGAHAARSPCPVAWLRRRNSQSARGAGGIRTTGKATGLLLNSSADTLERGGRARCDERQDQNPGLGSPCHASILARKHPIRRPSRALHACTRKLSLNPSAG